MTEARQLGIFTQGKNEIALGWFAYTFPYDLLVDMVRLLGSHLETVFEGAPHGMNGYSRVLVSGYGRGCAVAFSPPGNGICRVLEENGCKVSDFPGWEPEGHRKEAYCTISASIIETVGMAKFLCFLDELQHYSIKVTRIDISYDDYDKLISPSEMRDWVKRGLLCGFRNYRFLASSTSGGDEACTLELGARGKNGAGKFVRYYDKSRESRGKLNCYRYEVELSQGYAVEAYEALRVYFNSGYSGEHFKQASEGFCRVAASILAGMLDFRERDSSGRLDRSARLSRWKLFIEGLSSESVKLRVERVARKFADKLAWLENAVAPSLAIVYEVFAAVDPFGSRFESWAEGLIERGRARWGVVHQQVMREGLAAPSLAVPVAV